MSACRFRARVLGGKQLETIIVDVAIIIVITGIAVGGLALVDAVVPASRRAGLNDVTGFIYAFVGPLYAILLAFVVFAVWGFYIDARRTAETEATALYKIYKISQAMEPAYAARIQRLAMAYGDSVIEDEWPMMSTGKGASKKTRTAFATLEDGVADYQPQTAQQSALYQVELTNIDDLAGIRNNRLLQAHDVLNSALWIALIVGGVLSLGYSYLFGAGNRWAHSIMVAVLAVSVAGMLILIATIDDPYRGDVRVRPTAMQDTLDLITHPTVVPIPP